MNLIQILAEGAMTRDELVQRTGLPRTTLWDMLRPHMKAGVVVRQPRYLAERRRGRPTIEFKLVEAEQRG